MIRQTSYTFLLSILSVISFGQQQDSARIRVTRGSKIEEIRELFDIDKIDYFKVTAKDTTLRNTYFILTIAEYWNGKLTKRDTILSDEESKESLRYTDSDTAFSFTLMTKPANAEKINFSFRFPSMGMQTKFKKINSDNYSLRDAINSDGEFVNVPKNRTFPLLVYSLPYQDPKKPGYLFYCELTADSVPPEQWGKKYNIKHYIIVYMRIKSK